MSELRPGPLFAIKVGFYRALMAVLKLVVLLVPTAKPMVLVGPGSVRQLCRTIGQFGHRKVLIVTDAMLVKLGIIEPIARELRGAGVEVSVFDEVQPDPGFELADRGGKEIVDRGCDAVLAVGGGSPIDAAKVMAACATNDKSASKLAGILKLKNPTTPLYAVPTTAGTGSETTIAAVLSDFEEQLKKPVVDPKLVPAATALDPELMTGLPGPITAATGMDALTHAVESYLSRHATEETDRLALAATRLIFANLPRAFKQGEDLAAREAMAMAAFFAGAAFTKANVGYVHAIAHQFGARYHTPHGLANAIVLPYVLDYSRPAIVARLANLGRAAGLTGDDGALATQFIQAVRDLAASLDIPTQLEALQAGDIDGIARAALKEAHYLYPVPRYMDLRCCRTLIERMLPTPA